MLSVLIPNLFSLVCIVAYIATCVRLLNAVRLDTPINPSLQFYIGLVGSLSHLTAMALLMIQPEGIDFSLLKSASLVLATAVLFVTLSSQRFAIQTIQLGLMPIAGLFLILSVSLPSSLEPLILSLGTGVHIILSILAYGTYTVAAVMALLLGYSSLRLKHHKMTSLVKHVPPIEALETMLFELIALGTVLLALSVVTGFLFLDDIFAQHLIHKTALSIVALVIFSIISFGHWQYGWRGSRIMRWIFGAYITLTLAYIGSKFVLEWVIN